MPLITWNDSLSVNIRKIDNQHQKLIGMINDLDAAMKEREGQTAIGKIISDLLDYTDYHFKTEEDFFVQYHYPELAHHKKTHTQLFQKAATLKQEYDSGRKMVSVKVLNLLSDWLWDHIMKTDKEYSEFLNGKGLT